MSTARLGTGTLTGISGAPPSGANTLPLPGFARVCLFWTDCATNLPLYLTLNNGNTGIGVGGAADPRRVGLDPDLARGRALDPRDAHRRQSDGGRRLRHAVARRLRARRRIGTDSSTAVTSGVIQLITPTQVTTSGVPGNSIKQALFSTLTLHFIPEPGLLLLLASGVVGLGLLGRGRMKK